MVASLLGAWLAHTMVGEAPGSGTMVRAIVESQWEDEKMAQAQLWIKKFKVLILLEIGRNGKKCLEWLDIDKMAGNGLELLGLFTGWAQENTGYKNWGMGDWEIFNWV